MAAKGRDRLLPLPCDPGKHRSVECLWTTPTAIVVALSASPQSTASRVGSHAFGLRPMDSSPSRFASLSSDPLSRYSSKVGAVCVEALVRICAGGDSVTIVPTASLETLVTDPISSAALQETADFVVAKLNEIPRARFPQYACISQERHDHGDVV